MATMKTLSKCWALMKFTRRPTVQPRFARFCPKRNVPGSSTRHTARERPMRRIHPAGLYEAVFDERGMQGNRTRTQPLAPGPQPYQLRVNYKSGETITMHDPYAFAPMLTDYDLHLLGEGTHWRSYERLVLNSPRSTASPVSTSPSGRRTRRALRSSANSTVGPPQPHDAQAHSQRRMGIVHPRHRRGEAVQIRRQESRWPRGREMRSLRFSAEVPPRTANIVTNLDSYKWNDAEWIGNGRSTMRLECADVDLRAAPGQLAARSGDREPLAQLRRAGAADRRLLPPDGFHAHPIDAGQRAPVHGKLGLSNNWLLCRHEPLRHATRFHVFCRLATKTASA